MNDRCRPSGMLLTTRQRVHRLPHSITLLRTPGPWLSTALVPGPSTPPHEPARSAWSLCSGPVIIISNTPPRICVYHAAAEIKITRVRSNRCVDRIAPSCPLVRHTRYRTVPTALSRHGQRATGRTTTRTHPTRWRRRHGYLTVDNSCQPRDDCARLAGPPWTHGKESHIWWTWCIASQ
jgi:hypothetical protein